jgi:hypothetical protein
LYQKYKEIGLTLEEFEGPKYMRIAHIKELIGHNIIDESLRRKKT